MKTPLLLVAVRFLVLSSLLMSAAFGQGNLNPPPGAPAPTMKSLDQIEARTPISTAPYTISAPGSYYLTQNLTVSSGDAITINASGVTLDLNGFTISSTAGTAGGMGINLVRPNHDISILNGHIAGGVTYVSGSFSTGPGFQNGIGFSGLTIQLQNVRISGVSVWGVSGNGITPGGDSTVIDHCEVRTAGATGISGNLVTDCVVNTSGSTGIAAVVVANCRAVAVGGATGISATTASNCYGDTDTGTGISAQNALNCWGRSNATGTAGTGLDAHRAENCTGFSDAGIGLNAGQALNCFGAAGSGIGLYATSVSSSYGSSISNAGLYAITASNCHGISGSGDGLAATMAWYCYGESTTGNGLYAANAYGCYGIGNGGLIVDNLAEGCYGKAIGGNYGIQVAVAINCYGEYAGTTNVQSFGIYAMKIAIGCFGTNSFSTRAILTTIANCCSGSSTVGGALISTTFKYNMP